MPLKLYTINEVMSDEFLIHHSSLHIHHYYVNMLRPTQWEWL